MESISSTLIQSAKGGSEEALQRLFSTCGERLLALIRLRLGATLRRRLESRDILQATMLKAFGNIERLQGNSGASFMAWLVAIAENEIRDQADFHRRQRRDPAVEQAIEHAEEVVDRVRSQTSRLALSEEMARVEKGIEGLSVDHREVILLRYFSELSYKEIGSRMGRSPDACRVLFARAMASLTRIMGTNS